MKNILYIIGNLILCTHSIFTHKDSIEGNVGIGRLPNELLAILDDISSKYIHLIPDKTKTTFHTYYNDLEGSLQQSFDRIQLNPIWNNICIKNERNERNENCIMQPVKEMNEIYYSNPKPNFETTNLYGAAANLIPHHDCVLFHFKNINFYRVIIGITENNTDTITEFIHIGVEHRINRGDYMIFDFDKTLHQVKKTGTSETPRILLKLHFIVCDNCHSSLYVSFCAFFYKIYYYIARYTEQIGTDPTTFIGFFFGLLWEYPFYIPSKYVAVVLVTNMILYKTCNYYLLKVLLFYLLIVSFYYLRYTIFSIK